MDADFLEKTMNMFKLQEGQQKSCAVCNEVAHSCNFGVITCDPCKAFFRRNAHKESIMEKCTRTCDITGRLRSSCQSCRLKKCFDKGMQRDLILSEEMKIIRKKKIEANRLKRLNLSIGSTPSSKQNSPCSSSSLGSPLPLSPDSYHHDRAELRTSKSCGQLSDAIRPNLLSLRTSCAYNNQPSATDAANWFNFDIKSPVLTPDNNSPNRVKYKTTQVSDCAFQTPVSPKSPFDLSPRNSSCPSSFSYYGSSSSCGNITNTGGIPGNPLVGQQGMMPIYQGCNANIYQMGEQTNNIMESNIYSNEVATHYNPSETQNGMLHRTYPNYKQSGCNNSVSRKSGLTRLANSCPAFSIKDTKSYNSVFKSTSFANTLPDHGTNTCVHSPLSLAMPLQEGDVPFDNEAITFSTEKDCCKGDEFLKASGYFVTEETDLRPSLESTTKNHCKPENKWEQNVPCIKTEKQDCEIPSSNCDCVAPLGQDDTLPQCLFVMESHLQDTANNMMSAFADFLNKLSSEHKKCLRTLEDILSAYEDCIRECVTLTKQLIPFQALQRNGQIELLQNNLLQMVHILFLHLHDTSDELHQLTDTTAQHTPLQKDPLFLQYLNCCKSAKASLAPIQDNAVIQGCIMSLVLFSPSLPEQQLFLHSDFVLHWHRIFWQILESYLSQQQCGGNMSSVMHTVEEFLTKNSALGEVAKKMLSTCSVSKLSPLITEAFDIHPK